MNGNVPPKKQTQCQKKKKKNSSPDLELLFFTIPAQWLYTTGPMTAM